jgi:phosphoribosyl 1,2-cyclic phosphodiesterase
MKFTFWGTRGSIAVPGPDTLRYGGNTTCLEIELQNGARVIVDAGSGIRPLGQQLFAAGRPIEVHLLITHTHWDHIQGFPFFEPVKFTDTRIFLYRFADRTNDLERAFEANTSVGFFPLDLADFEADIRQVDAPLVEPIDIHGVKIDRIPVRHEQNALGFRFREGKKTLVFIPDNEVPPPAERGQHYDELVRFCHGADVLVHDAQYTPSEMAKRRGHGHSDYESAIELAEASKAKQLFLFHHDPFRTDSDMDRMTADAQALAQKVQPDLKVEAAKEGRTVVL